MTAPILLTKLFIPSPRPGMVPRSRLVERLNGGLDARRKLTLISAPAGFGKSTLVSEWIATCGRREPKVHGPKAPTAAWLSLDEGDSDPVRFIS